ncbi:MAG: YncE family protein [Candidatus Caenarcaniphilales bacterium]|nr:YncE family protein [Candidatus Caenarcaniphilales bacterium]
MKKQNLLKRLFITFLSLSITVQPFSSLAAEENKTEALTQTSKEIGKTAAKAIKPESETKVSNDSKLTETSGKKQDLYYLSSSGYLIKLDIDTISETGQVSAGMMPWGAASCGGHIYLTDFGSDQILDFAPEDKSINRVKIEDPTDSFASQEVELFIKPSVEDKKSAIQKTFERIHKPKKQPEKYNIAKEPLEIANHNKKLGLGSIACNKDYVFVVVTLKNRVEVLSRDSMKKVASFIVGERPSHISVSPDGGALAITSAGLNKVYLSNVGSGFSRIGEIDVEEGPTEVSWANNEQIYVLNRGAKTISILNTQTMSSVKTLSFDDAAINTMLAAPLQNKLYALDGTGKKLYVINATNFTHEVREVNDSLKYPGLLNMVRENQLLIGSEPDGRFLILDTNNFESVKKIQTNLPPKVIVQLVESKELANDTNFTKNYNKSISRNTNTGKPKTSFFKRERNKD